MHITGPSSHESEIHSHGIHQKEGVEKARIEKANYFQIFFQKYVGYPPSRNLLSNFIEFNNFINRPKQTPQNKKISKVRDRCFKMRKKPKSETQEEHLFMHEHINEQLHYSEDRMNDLREEIKERLKKISITKILRHQEVKDIVELLIYSHWMGIDPFVKLYFAAQLIFADQLIKDGLVLTKLSSIALIKQILNELLPPRSPV